MTRAHRTERLRFRSFAAVLTGRSAAACWLRIGGRTVSLPLSTLSLLTARAVTAAEIGDPIDPVQIEAWKADDLGLRAAPDPAQPGLFSQGDAQ